jgi:hypothetical protein
MLEGSGIIMLSQTLLKAPYQLFTDVFGAQKS